MPVALPIVACVTMARSNVAAALAAVAYVVAAAA